MISLERREGRPLRIGHRGAATLAPANTLPSLRAALEVGVDLIEFDVVAGSDGTLVCSHSPGEIQAETPTLDEILAFFVDEAPEIGVSTGQACVIHDRASGSRVLGGGFIRRFAS